jgi:cell division protein FtsB
LALLCGLAVFIAGVWCIFERDAIADYFHSQDLRDQEKTRVDRLGNQVRELEQERDRLEKDATFEREKVARSRFHWSRPGERVLLLESPDRVGQSAAAKPTTATVGK